VAREKRQGRAGQIEAVTRRKEKETNRYLCNGWHWWVISPNSMRKYKSPGSGVPLEELHKKRGVDLQGSNSTCRAGKPGVEQSQTAS